MGDSGCLMVAFPYASDLSSHQPKQGNPMHALGESISFGRFMTESLAWEKWSTFTHKRYVEEAERYSQPGLVAQKKAFFEAHYKRLAAQKAAALLEQANSVNNITEPQVEARESEDSPAVFCNYNETVEEQKVPDAQVHAVIVESNEVEIDKEYQKTPVTEFDKMNKRIAAQMAAALLEQANSVNNITKPQVETRESEDSPAVFGYSNDIVDEQKVPDAQVRVVIAESNEVEIDKVDQKTPVTENEISMENPVENNNSMNQLPNLESQDTVKTGSETSGTQKVDKSLLYVMEIDRQNSIAKQENPSVTSKKRSAFSTFKSWICWRTTKVSRTHAKPVTPSIPKSNVDIMEPEKIQIPVTKQTAAANEVFNHGAIPSSDSRSCSKVQSPELSTPCVLTTETAKKELNVEKKFNANNTPKEKTGSKFIKLRHILFFKA